MLKEDIIDLELELSTFCNAKCPLCYRNYQSFATHYPKPIIRPLKEVIKQISE